MMFAFVLFVGASCSSGKDDAAPTTTPIAPPTVAEEAARGNFGVGVTTLSLIDISRPTEANREYPGSPQREMDVEIWYPAAASDAIEQRDVAVSSKAGRTR